MKAIKEMVREHGTDDPSKQTYASIARRAYVQRMLQQSAALSLATWLRSQGAECAPFSWSYER